MIEVSRAKMSYKHFELDWNNRLEDALYVDYACRFLNEALAYLLKALLLSNGIDPKHTHVLGELINMLPNQYASAEWYTILRTYISEVADWSSRTRYGSSFSVLSETVYALHNAYNLLLDDVEGNTTYESTLDTQVTAILVKLGSHYTAEQVIRYLPSVDMPYDVLFDAVKTAVKLISSK